MTPEQKKAFKEAKVRFNLHVGMIELEGKSKADALVLAYQEGNAGLNVRLTGTADGARK